MVAMTNPKITLVYICPVESCGTIYFNYACRFVASYHKFPPEMEHEIIVVSNGGKPSGQTQILFSSIPNAKLIENDNVGLDIGAFQKFAGLVDCDLMLCLGASIYFHRKGWLKRLVEAWREKGRGVYGTSCNYEISPHIRPSFVMLDPKLLLAYPYKIRSRKDCLAFESGRWKRKMNFTVWSENLGFLNWMVTWDGIYGIREWDNPDNVFRKGNQSSMLALDHQADDFDSGDFNEKSFLHNISYSAKTQSIAAQYTARLCRRMKCFAGKLSGKAKLKCLI